MSKKLDKRNVEDILSLTPLQQGMLFHYLKDPESSLYVVQQAIGLRGRTDRARIEETWNRIIEKTPALRSVFRWNTGKSLQIVLKQYIIEVTQTDLSELDEAAARETLQAQLVRDRKQPFDLEDVPFRITLFKYAEDHHEMVITNHHILLDGWSNGIVLGEFFRIHEVLLAGGMPSVSGPYGFKPFINYLRGLDEAQITRYWQTELADYDNDREWFDAGSVVPRIEAFGFSAQLGQRIEALCKQQKVTLATFLYTAWGILLQKHENRSDVVFGTTVSGRTSRVDEMDRMIGMFINTLPLRQSNHRGAPISEILAAQQQKVSGREAYEQSSLAEIKTSTGLDHLFDSLVVIENFPIDKVFRNDARLAIASYEAFEQTELDLIWKYAGIEQMEFMYNGNRFQVDEIRRRIGQLQHIIEAMVAQVTQPLARIEIISAEEKRRVLELNDTTHPYPSEATLHSLFRRQAERTPDELAMVLGTERLSYRVLDQRSDALAHVLRRKGVTPGQVVTLFAERSPSAITAMLAVLKAGAAFSPIDPASPDSRIRYMLENSGAQLTLVQAHLKRRLHIVGTVVDLDDETHYASHEPFPHEADAPLSLAYIIYTSGSTGNPKGVMVSHRAVVRLAMDSDFIDLSRERCILSTCSFVFDVSAFEIWSALLNGLPLVLVDAHTLIDPWLLEEAIARFEVSTMWLTTPLFNQLSQENPTMFRQLRTLVIGGDALVPECINAVKRACPGVNLVNGYGPTENAIFSTTYHIEAFHQQRIPIGRPIRNSTTYVLDRDLNMQPIGVPGELCLGGDGVARGYLQAPRQTALKFIPDPFRPDGRLYLSGDRARWREDGTIDFLGRMDHQIKLRGYRIELGEIGRALAEHAAVKRELITLNKEDLGQGTLIAYYTGDDAVDSAELAAFLRERLPDYMVPAHFIHLAKFPLNPSGKIDRKRLPLPESRATDMAEFVALESDTEKALAEIWQAVLGGEAPSRMAHFFEAGGHSLKATMLVSRIRKQFECDLQLSDIFDKPLLQQLAQAIDKLVHGDEAAVAGDTEQPAEILPSATTGGAIPLSFSQQRLWFLDRFDPNSYHYNLPGLLELEGPLSVAAWRASLEHITRRHGSMRTVFRDPTGEGKAEQVVLADDEARITLPLVDLRGVDAETCERELERLSTHEARFVFDLAEGPLFRAHLLRLSETRHFMLINMHHIISDGWSVGVLMREWSTAYRSLTQGQTPPAMTLPVQYTDFTYWQRQWMAGEDAKRQLAYWREQLAGSTHLRLVTDRKRPAKQTFTGALHRFFVPRAISNRLRELANREGLSLFMVLMAGYKLMLSRYSHRGDIAVGTPIANRNHREIEGLIGFFVNTLVLRTDLSRATNFIELLGLERDVALAAYAHQDLPFEKLVDELEPTRDLSYTPLFQVFFNLQNAMAEGEDFGALNVSWRDLPGEVAKFDLSLTLEEERGRLQAAFEYNRDLFDRGTIVRMAGHYNLVLETLARQPDMPLARFVLQTEAERQLIEDWNRTETDYPREQHIAAIFREQAWRSPEAPAILHERLPMSYGQLEAASNQLAAYLIRLGVRRGERVGMCIERSPEMIVALLAILKTGSAYLPLDPNNPEERLKFMIEDGGVRYLLTDGKSNLPTAGLRVIDPLAEAAAIAAETDRAIPLALSADDVAYINYTSGSTGKPKGVLVPHRGVLRLVKNTNFLTYEPENVFLHSSTVGFDLATFEIWGPLLNGAKLVLLPPGAPSPEDYGRTIRRFGVDTIWLTAGLFQVIVESFPDELIGVRRLLAGGDALSLPHVEKAMQIEGVHVIDGYGPTENTTFTACHPVDYLEVDRGSVPIGKPVSNTQVYLLDARARPVPLGTPGELYAGGDGLAVGYLNRPDLTAQRFVPNPFSTVPGSRMYATGDLARYLPDGRLEFHGRIDNQVKIRGFRIEPGEVETLLSKHREVKDNTVQVREDTPGDKRLVAYVVPEDRETFSATALRAELKQHLPEYLVPSAFVVMEAIPLNLNGKVDRKALPAPDKTQGNDEGHFEEASSANEKALAAIWCGVLGLERVGIHNNFFELGGDSILSIQVVARANQQGLKISPKLLFEYQTIAELARHCGTAVQVEAEQGAVIGTVPLLPIQRWFFQLNAPRPHYFNQSALLRTREPLQPEALTRALDHLLSHHDALRLRYHEDAEGWQQHGVEPGATMPLRVFTRTDLADPAAFVTAEAEALQASLDIEHGPLAGAAYFDLGEAGTRLLIVIHHLAVDGVSWRILLEDLGTLYHQALDGATLHLPAKTTSYKAWSEALATFAESETCRSERDYWQTQTREVPPLIAEVAAGSNLEGDSETVSFALDREQTRALLQEVPAAYRTQINDILLAALLRALNQQFGQRTLLLNLEGHGRESIAEGIDLSRTVGWMTAMYPLRMSLPSTPELGELVKTVKEQLRAVPRKGLCYGLLRQCGDVAAGAEPQISFNYLGQFDQLVDQTSLFQPADESPGVNFAPETPRAHLIDFNGAIYEGRLQLDLIYAGKLLAREQMAAIARDYEAALVEIITHCRQGRRGYTPSDFPLAHMERDQLERILAGRTDVEDLYPLSPMQEGMLFHSRLHEGGGDYVTQIGFTLKGNLKRDSFVEAWRRVVARHGILRTIFPANQPGEDAVQIVLEQAEPDYHFHDWRHQTAEEREAHFAAFTREDRSAGFDFLTPPMRFHLITFSKRELRFLWTHHHALIDGWSLPLVVGEVLRTYAALERGEELRLPTVRPYRHFIAWLAERDTQAAETYWRERLAGFDSPTPLNMGRDLKRQIAEDYNRHETASLGERSTAALQEFVRTHQLTLNTLLQGAWAFLLSRYSGEGDVVFGATVSGRPGDLDQVEQMVGLFINTLPIRVTVLDRMALLDWLHRLQGEQAEMRQYEHTALVDVQALSDVPAGTPLFESLFVFENYPVDETSGGQTLELSDVVGLEQANFPMIMVVAPGTELGFRIMYDARRFDSATVKRILQQMTTLVTNMLASPHGKLAELHFMSSAARMEILLDWSHTSSLRPNDKTIGTLFEQWAAKTPEATAARFLDERLTYGELNSRANRLARHLQTLGVGPGTMVGFWIPRSLDMIVGLLAVLKAGGAYMPMDPEFPEDRLAYMLELAGVRLLVTLQSFTDRVPSGLDSLALDGDWHAEHAYSEENLPCQIMHEHLAYTLFTSGSTGEPKGVCVPHRAVVSLLLHANYVKITPDDVLLLASTISFDAATFEIWGALLNGATVAILPSTSPSLDDWEQLLAHYRVSVLFLTVGLFNLIVDNRLNALKDVKQLYVGGEIVSPDHIRRALGLEGVKLHNIYGPTESTTFTTWYPIAPEDAALTNILIGKPIARRGIYILDSNMNPVAQGVPGEIYVAGEGLAHGYLQRPMLTARKFVPNPFSDTPGERLYRTGDQARFVSGGYIEFIGRVDYQVKIRGFRIEPGEIEAVLDDMDMIKNAVVLAREDEPGEKELVAYVVPSAEAELDLVAVRRELERKLPNFMIPGVIMTLSHLPLTMTGKIDRKALPRPKRGSGEDGYTPPRNLSEELAATVWAQTLSLDRIGIHDDFFELGGHSLRATQAISRLREVFGTHIALRDLFENPTVASFTARLAAHVEHMRDEPIARVDRAQQIPLSFAQQRLWFIDNLIPDSNIYNIPLALELKGDVRVEHLERALDELTRRHETLRTTIAEEQGRAYQVIAPHRETTLPVTHLDELNEADRTARLTRYFDEEVKHHFALDRGPLIRTHLLVLGAEHYVLLINMHHIISDGWSTGVLLSELHTLYNAFARGEVSPLAPLPIQYADFSAWQRSEAVVDMLDGQLAYWKARLPRNPEPLDLPLDKARPAAQTFAGAHWRFPLGRELTAELEQLCRREGATTFMALLATFQLLLHRYSGRTDILTGSPIANRNRKEIEGLIGFFVNTLVFHSEISGELSYSELLGQVRETSLEAFAHQDLPFERLIDELHPDRDLSRTPLFQVLFVLQNAPLELRDFDGVSVRPLPQDAPIAKFDLTLAVEVEEDGLYGQFEYNTDLFEQATVATMARHYVHLLQAVCAEPGRKLAWIDMLSGEERALLASWNETATDYPREETIVSLFAAMARQNPDAPCLITEEARLSYGQVARRANQLSHFLLSMGASRGQRIGILHRRSPEMIIGLLGILGAGCAYLPLDPDYPEERLRYMIEDGEVSILLSETGVEASLPEGLTKVYMDRDAHTIGEESTDAPEQKPGPEELAYINYTSGSTGQPKGVMTPHRAVVRLVKSSNYLDITRENVFLQASTVSFDAATLEIWGPLLAGGQLVLLPPGKAGPEDYGRHIREFGVDTLWLTAGLFRVFVETYPEQLRGIRRLLAGGDVLSPTHVARAGEIEGLQVINGYGPTENTTFTCCYPVPAGEVAESVPIGRPIANTRVYILDERLERVPPGVPGQLYASGDGLARGYLGRAALTAEKFVPNPHERVAGARMYATGDRARYNRKGEVLFMGRADQQVKIRGFRIEPGEVETVLSRYEAIRDQTVIVREDTPGDKRLTAYLVLEEGSEITPEGLRVDLKQHLPEYMIPAAIVKLPEIPLTPNGKVDRRALPAPIVEVGHELAETDREKILSEIWAEVLGLERVGVNDNFFQLGGDSILSIQIVARANGAGLRMKTRDVFEYQTIARLAEIVEEAPRIAAEQGAVTGEVAMQPMQHWFYEQAFSTPEHFNQSVLLNVTEAVETQHLRAALAALQQHHDGLRARYSYADGSWRQHLAAPDEALPLRIVDLSPVAPSQQGRVVEETVAATQASLDLENGPVWRIDYFTGGQPHNRLFLVIHHHVVDGVSWRILLDDLETALNQVRQGKAIVLPAKTTSLQQWGARLAETARGEAVQAQLPYWQAVLAAQVETAALDDPAGANHEAATEQVTDRLTSEETRALLTEVHSAYQTQIEDLLLTALWEAWQHTTGAERLAIDLEGHGREEIGEDIDISRTLGWFTAMYPVVLDSGGATNPGDKLKTIKEGLRAIPHKGIGYGLLRYLDPANPLPEDPHGKTRIGFNYLGQFDQMTSAESLFATATESPGPNLAPDTERWHHLDLTILVAEGKLEVIWMYGQVYQRDTIERLSTAYMAALRELIAHCQNPESWGFTASDFTEFNWDQDDLNDIMEGLEELE